MDIHQQLLRKKIHKNRVMKNFASKVRTKYARTKDRILGELSKEEKYDDPMFKKKVDFYNQLFQPGTNVQDMNEEKGEDQKQPLPNPRNQKKTPLENKPKQPEKKLTKAERSQLIQEKIEKKKKESRRLMQKTSKGQPVMSNMINHLLKKIVNKK